MTIREIVFDTFNLTGSAITIAGGIDLAIRRICKSTAADLFKRSFVKEVNRNSQYLAHFTETRNPETVDVHISALDKVIDSLKDDLVSMLTSLEENKQLTRITSLFSACINVPGHQLTSTEFEQRIQPVVGKAIIDFLKQLPFKQEAFNQIVLEFIQENAADQMQARLFYTSFLDKFDEVMLDVQENLIGIRERTGEIKDAIKEMSREMSTQFDALPARVQKLSRSHANVSIPVGVAAERQPEIDNARDLLKQNRPTAALELLERLKQQNWTDASSSKRYRILTNMGAAKLALNKEHEAAMLLLEAFQYNPEEEKAISNRALAHFLLGEVEEAARYANKTLEQNPANIDAYVVLVRISTHEDTLKDIVINVPEHLREVPQIAHAISEIARQRKDFEQAIKWGETSLSRAQDGVANYQAALARILVEQISNHRSAMLTQQLDDSHKEQLKRAVELFTEAWNSVNNTEMRTVETDWIIWKSTALELLGEYSAATEVINTAIQIEPDYPVLYRKRALLALKQGDYHGSIGFLETIQSALETPEAPILLANILLVVERLEEAKIKLNDFLMTDPDAPLREEANRLLIKVHVARGDLDKAKEISTTMRESSPTSVLNLVDAVRIAEVTGNTDEVLSLLNEAFGYAQNSQGLQDLVELAEQLCIHEQFDKAATLYEKLADTRQNSQWTERLLYSYYRSGEIGKALEICKTLREKYGPLKYISEMEYAIYDEIGDLNQARAVCEVYINAFPDDADMQIRLGVVHLRSNNPEEIDCLLEKSYDLKNLSLQSCLNLANLYQIRFQPRKALDIMYEVRRTYYNHAEAHLKYIGLYYQVDKELGELLSPTQVEPDTAVYLENSRPNNWYIIEQREDADIRRNELNVNHPLAQRLFGKTVSDEVCLQQNIVSQQFEKITEIKSKYVHALQESFRKFSELFPDTAGVGSIKLDDSHHTDDSEQLRPLFDFIDRQDEASRQIEKFYREYIPPIGVFANFTGRDLLDTWGLLISKPNLGVRCSVGTLDEWGQALALLGDSKAKLAVDFISLMTIHGIGAADAVIKAFGKLGIALSTIDELQHIINVREGMWSNREGMSVGKQGDQYVKTFITPADVRRNIEYLKNIRDWIGTNCEVIPINPALQVNQFRRRELDNAFQSLFVDTLLIASQPNYLLFSDDEKLRSYAKSNFSVDVGIQCHIDGVWTQVVLQHCCNRNLLDKAEYDSMTIKLACSHYYNTTFDANLLFEAARQSAWRPSEPYSTLIQTLGNQKTNLLSALNIAVDFLHKLWLEPIERGKQEYLTLELLGALTLGQGTREILNPLAEGIREKFTILPLAEQAILSLIQTYTQTHPRNLIHLVSSPPTSFTSFPPRTSQEEKLKLMPTTAEQAAANGDVPMAYAEAQFRRLCAERGLNWDTMTDAERENFVDDLVHEDRECSP